MERYNVVRVTRNFGRRTVLATGLTEKEAQEMVQSYPDSEKSMVIYTKQ